MKSSLKSGGFMEVKDPLSKATVKIFSKSWLGTGAETITTFDAKTAEVKHWW